MDSLGSLGDDLVLLSVSAYDGRLTTAQRLSFALMGSELVRLAAAGRITITGGRVEVIDPSSGQDLFLDEALASLAGARREARAKTWVSRPRRGIAQAYLERLAAAGVLEVERGTRLGIFPVTRWRVADAGRQVEARARLDAVALSDGPVSTAQAALAGLAYAAGLGTVLYPGRTGRPGRARLERIAKGGEVAAIMPDTGSAAGDAASQAMAAANQATRAAVDAATAAATQAAIDAATAAAVQAATDAAHSAAHGAHGGGGGHGH